MNNMKLTRKLFCSIYKEMNRLRINDPLQFSVLYNEWKRGINKSL